MDPTSRTPILFLLCLTLLAPAPALAAAMDDGGCNNYGYVVQAGVGNEYRCTYIVQHCDQGTGAGAAAGAGGPGENEAGAAATAGTQCRQGEGRSWHVPDSILLPPTDADADASTPEGSWR
jgi:hypothetical protein